MRKKSRVVFPYFLFYIFILNVFFSFTVEATIVELNEEEMKLIRGGNPSQMCPSICMGTETNCNGCKFEIGGSCGGPAWEYPNPYIRGCRSGGSQTCVRQQDLSLCSKEFQCGWTATQLNAICLYWGWPCTTTSIGLCLACGKLANPIITQVYHFVCN